MAEDRMLNDEILLGLIKANSGGGGGGTTDYEDLDNLPKINSVELKGNKSLSDLGIASAQSVTNITNGESINNFAGVETALATKQTASDNSLETDAKTIVGAINENASNIGSLKSGLTDLSEEVNGDATTYPYAYVITIPDAVPANVADCSVKIEPVQDLHGYDNPWVGGAGKNLLPMTVDGIKAENTSGTWSGNTYTKNDGTFTVNTDNDGNVISITANGTFTSQCIIYCTSFATGNFTLKAGSYKFGCASSSFSSTNRIRYRDSGGFFAITNSVINRTYETDSLIECAIVIEAGTVSNLVFQPMVYLATETDDSFAPYTNYCPITGHTEASVQMDGKNILDMSTFKRISMNDGSADNNWITFDQKIPCYGKNAFYFSSSTDKSIYRFVINLYDDNKNILTQKYIEFVNVSGFSFTIDNASAAYFKCGFYHNVSIADVSFTDAQIEAGTAKTPYVPYAGKTYTLALGDTIYGGTVDFDSGVMTVTHKYVDLGDYNFYKSGNNWYSQDITDFKRQSTGTTQRALFCICDKYPYNGKNGEAQIQLYYNTDYSGYRCFIFDDHNADNMNGAQFHTYITGTHICYELATPTTIQLTPQQIQLLKGTNTLTASTGQISVTVNGVSGSIGAVQEQVNELAEDVEDIEDDVTELQGGVTNLNNTNKQSYERIGYTQRTDTENIDILLGDKDLTNYDVVYIVNSYYDQGVATYGSLLVPTKIFMAKYSTDSGIVMLTQDINSNLMPISCTYDYTTNKISINVGGIKSKGRYYVVFGVKYRNLV